MCLPKPRIHFGRVPDMRYGPRHSVWVCEGRGWLAYGDSPAEAFNRWSNSTISFV